ncbi:MAG: hypothetical protein M5U28_54685 [Sandaracinaceae bacterium]|nr:hypothetical protein [Sandaracinaceae bacterium]
MIALFVLGCRDLVDDGGRLSDQHILRGRTPPHLLDGELRAGWFVSTDAHLLPLETWVRTHLGGTFSLRGFRPDRGIRPDAEGTVTFLNFTNGSLLRPSPPSMLGGTPFVTHDTDLLREEYRELCGRPGWSNLAPAVGPAEDRCNPLSIPGAAGTFIDDVIVTVNSELIEIDWAPPSTTLNPLSDIRGLSASSSAEDRGTCSRGCGPGFSCPPGAPADSLCELTPVPCAEHRDCADVEGHTGETREAFLQMQTLGLDSPRISTLGVVSAQCGGAPGDACTPGVTDCGPGRSCACPRGEACDQPRCLASCAARVVTHLGRDASLTAPVLRVRMPLGLEVDSEEAGDLFLGAVNLHSVDAELRVQPIIETTRRRLREGVPIALAYRGASPAGDAVTRRANVDLGIRTDTRNAVVEVVPGWLLASYCLLPPVDPLPVDPFCRIITEQLQRIGAAAVDEAFVGVGTLLDVLAGAPGLPGPLPIPTPGLRSNLPTALCEAIESPCPLTEEAARQLVSGARVDLAASTFDVGFSRDPVTLAGPGGTITRTTMRLLGSGGTLNSLSLDLSTFAGLCAPDAAACEGPEPDPRCEVCRECADLGPSRLCSFGAPLRVSVSMDLRASIQETFEIPLDVPPSPTLAALLDMMPNLVLELHGLFAGALSTRFGHPAPARYTSARYCVMGEPECPFAGGGLFTFISDRDEDGVPDEDDVCPTDWDPSQADADGDGLGDACDGCPCVRSLDDSDRDGDGIPDACDCDADDDLCTNPLVDVDPTLPGCVDPPCAYRAETRPPPARTRPSAGSAPRWSPGTMSRSAATSATDAPARTPTPRCPEATPSPDDCDFDDDADGILDDGAGDGIDVYTPCTDGMTAMCDDNCENTPNAAQRDADGDGSGDVCDLFDDDRAPPADDHFIDPGVAGAGFHPGFGLECLRDGPLCYAWAMFGCNVGSATLCGLSFDYVELFARRADLVDRMDAADYVGTATWGGAFAWIPDVDGDGFQEMVLGAPDADATLDGSVLARAGVVVAVGSRDGAELWRLSGVSAGARFGAALASTGEVLLVGASGAEDPGEVGTGGVYVVQLSGVPFIQGAFFGDRAGDSFGSAISLVGDPSRPGRSSACSWARRAPTPAAATPDASTRRRRAASACS